MENCIYCKRRQRRHENGGNHIFDLMPYSFVVSQSENCRLSIANDDRNYKNQ